MVRKKFKAQINVADARIAQTYEAEGVIQVTGSKTSGTPYVWIGSEGAGSYRAIIDTRSMDAVCRAWIRLRKLRGEW